MDQLSAMRAFLRVLETGNFTRASVALGMSKATVPTLIQTLDGHLPPQLLNRTTRLLLVPYSRALSYDRALRIFPYLSSLLVRLSIFPRFRQHLSLSFRSFFFP